MRWYAFHNRDRSGGRAVASAKSAVGDSLRFEGRPGSAVLLPLSIGRRLLVFPGEHVRRPAGRARFTVDRAAGCTVYDPSPGNTPVRKGPNGTIVLRGYRSAFFADTF